MANIIKFPGKFVGEAAEAAAKNLDDAAKVSANLVDFKTATKALNKHTSKYGGLKASEELLQFRTTKQAMDNLETTVKYSNNVVQFRPTQQAVQTVEQGGKKAGELIDFKTAKEAIETKRYGEKQTAKIYDFQEARNRKFNTNTTLNNLEKIKDLETVPMPTGEALTKTQNAARQNIDDFIRRDNYKSAQERLRNNKPGDIGPLMDEIKTTRIDDGPKTNSSGGNSGGGNNNNNTNTNTNSGPNDRRSWGDYANSYFGGITDTYKGTKAGDGFWNSLEAAHKNKDGTYRWDRIAGTYAAAALGSRVISGGGLYKDKYGNTNLPGIPFI